jgi:excisionase family DNA binding protein
MTEPEEKQAPAGGMAKLISETMLEKELASALGVKLSTVKRLRSQGEIPYIQVGGAGRVIYLVESIMEWLKRKEVREYERQ